jgi:hypothetical protein
VKLNKSGSNSVDIVMAVLNIGQNIVLDKELDLIAKQDD